MLKKYIASILLVSTFFLSVPFSVFAEIITDENGKVIFSGSTEGSTGTNVNNDPEDDFNIGTGQGTDTNSTGFNITTGVNSNPNQTLLGESAQKTQVNQGQVTSEASTLSTANNSGQGGTGQNSDGNFEAAAEGIAGCVGSVVSTMITGAVSSIAGSVTGVNQVPTNPVALNAKESTGIVGSGITWDQIGYCVANALIQYISQSTINWIKGGFEGSPAFVEDPGRFFKDIADQEAGAFIQELGGDFLCSQFKPQIQLAILQNHRTTPYNQRSQCTLSDVVENFDSFQQDFSKGGWAGWIELTQVPQNNPRGALQMAENELQGRIAARASNAKQELDWGKGYLPFKECETDANGRRINCKTTTPGQLIETQVSQTFGLSRDRLVMADEFDEVVTALVNELIKIALNEALSSGSD